MFRSEKQLVTVEYAFFRTRDAHHEHLVNQNRVENQDRVVQVALHAHHEHHELRGHRKLRGHREILHESESNNLEFMC